MLQNFPWKEQTDDSHINPHQQHFFPEYTTFLHVIQCNPLGQSRINYKYKFVHDLFACDTIEYRTKVYQRQKNEFAAI